MHTGWSFPPRAAHAFVSAADGLRSHGRGGGGGGFEDDAAVTGAESTGFGGEPSDTSMTDDACGVDASSAAAALGGIDTSTGSALAGAAFGAGDDPQPTTSESTTSKERPMARVSRDRRRRVHSC